MIVSRVGLSGARRARIRSSTGVVEDEEVLEAMEARDRRPSSRRDARWRASIGER